MEPDPASALKLAFVDEVGARLAGPDPAVLIGFDVSRYADLVAIAPECVIDFPIAEESIAGAALGMARCGLDTVVDLMFEAFLFRAFDVLATQLALGSVRPYPAGRVVIRALSAVMTGAGPQHTTVAYPALAELPHVQILAPAAPTDLHRALAEPAMAPVLVLLVPAETWSLPLRELTDGVYAHGAGDELAIVCPSFLLGRVERAIEGSDLEGRATVVVPSMIGRHSVDTALDALDDGIDQAIVVSHAAPRCALSPRRRVTWVPPLVKSHQDDGVSHLAERLRRSTLGRG